MSENRLINAGVVGNAKTFQKGSTLPVERSILVFDDLLGKLGYNIFILRVNGLDIIHVFLPLLVL